MPDHTESQPEPKPKPKPRPETERLATWCTVLLAQRPANRSVDSLNMYNERDCSSSIKAAQYELHLLLVQPKLSSRISQFH